MDRRGFIQLYDGLGVSVLYPTEARSEPDRIVVIGGGILGTSIAYHLARRGAHVVQCEKLRPGSGATEKSFARFKADYRTQPTPYNLLNRLGMFNWRQLQRDLQGELQIQWGGNVKWSPPGNAAEKLRLDVRQQDWRYATHLVDEADVHRLLPNVTPGPVGAASFSEQEGTVDPVQALAVLLKNAERFGVKLLYPCEVTGFELASGRISAVQTTRGRFPADVVVLAAGVGTPALAGKLGVRVPLKDSPGVLAHTPVVPPILERMAHPAGTFIKQNPDGGVVIRGSDFRGPRVTDASREHGQQLMRAAAQFVPRLDRVPLERMTLGWRPMPQDELPIVGFSQACPNLYIATMHSGMTLGPLMGQLTALEILDNADVDLLQPYRLSRFDGLT